MDHKQAVKFRRKYYDLLDRYGLKKNDIMVGGDIVELCQSEDLIKNNGVKVNWVGGECDNGGTFDLVLHIKSVSEQNEPHLIALKLEKANTKLPIGLEAVGYENLAKLGDNVYLIPDLKEIPHACNEGIFRYIQKFELPCHHKLAAKRMTEKCLPLWTKNKGYPVLKTYTHYRPLPRYLMELYHKTEHLEAIPRRELLWTYVIERAKGREFDLILQHLL